MTKRSKGLFGAIGSLWRLTIMGLAIVLLLAIYLNVTDQAGEETAALDPVDPPVIEEESSAEAEAEPEADEPEEAETPETAEVTEEAEAGSQETAQEDAAEVDDPFAGVISVPGDDATYELVNAFRRDDGAIEITTTRNLDGAVTQTTRLVTCAPLAVGTIAEGDGPRNDAPELERISLGTAPASLAAAACGALR